MYRIQLPKEMMKSLWQLREYCARPSIIEQARQAIKAYIKREEKKMGDSVESITEAICEHEAQKEK